MLGVASFVRYGVTRPRRRRTWTRSAGPTRQIPRSPPSHQPLPIDFAAQGSRWTPTAERGIYRSADGGRLEARSPRRQEPRCEHLSGPRPRILSSAFWDHQRTPGGLIGGPVSGSESSDGGEWTRPRGTPQSMGSRVAFSPRVPNCLRDTSPTMGLSFDDAARRGVG